MLAAKAYFREVLRVAVVLESGFLVAAGGHANGTDVPEPGV